MCLCIYRVSPTCHVNTNRRRQRAQIQNTPDWSATTTRLTRHTAKLPKGTARVISPPYLTPKIRAVLPPKWCPAEHGTDIIPQRNSRGINIINNRNITLLYAYWTVHHLDSWVKRDQLDVTCFIISLFNAQHVSDVNTSILRSLRLMCWVISWVVLI